MTKQVAYRGRWGVTSYRRISVWEKDGYVVVIDRGLATTYLGAKGEVADWREARLFKKEHNAHNAVWVARQADRAITGAHLTYVRTEENSVVPCWIHPGHTTTKP